MRHRALGVLMACRLVLGGPQAQFQDALVTASIERQRAMRRYPGDGLAVIEIILEFRPLDFLARSNPGNQEAFLPDSLADFGDRDRIFGEALHQDLPGPLQRSCDIGNTLVGLEIPGGLLFGHPVGGGQQLQGQGFQSGFTGNLRLGASLGFVGQV